MQEQELSKKVDIVLKERIVPTITNNNQYNQASEVIKEIKAIINKVNEYWNPVVKKAYETHKSLKEKYNAMADPLKESKRSIEQKMAVYWQEQKRKAKEEEIRLQREADERARKEKEKLLQKASEMKTESKQEEYKEKADAVVTPVVHVPSQTPKAEGVSFRTTYSFEVIDKKAFIQAAVNNNDDNMFAFIQLDESALNKLANSTKGKISFPGLKLQTNTTTVTRG